VTDTGPDYMLALKMLGGITRALLAITDTVDLTRMRRICEEMETLAPVLEPTASMRGGLDNLRSQSAYLATLQRFVTELKTLDQVPSDDREEPS
jgi:hypothetical protein